jgi:hypothetical protein
LGKRKFDQRLILEGEKDDRVFEKKEDKFNELSPLFLGSSIIVSTHPH